ncbi:hypothetical protein KIW84_040760 [Lathyrus oleraceus]|uniref:RRM domain-containing protein n=1 Tax=Pisum sativum TaxID=3888 RepID=A0A9D4X8D0_PEA|nr:hypothetical protein KIW84_040760 [Pisum sativum]
MRIQYAKTKSDCIAKEEKVEKKRFPEESKQSSVPNGTHGASNGGPTASFRPGSTSQEVAAPNVILFIENLPYETTGRMLEMLFEQYPGFKEVRSIDAKPGIAFVDFEDDIQSSMAMQALQGFKITPQNPMGADIQMMLAADVHIDTQELLSLDQLF